MIEGKDMTEKGSKMKRVTGMVVSILLFAGTTVLMAQKNPHEDVAKSMIKEKKVLSPSKKTVKKESKKIKENKKAISAGNDEEGGIRSGS